MSTTMAMEEVDNTCFLCTCELPEEIPSSKEDSMSLFEILEVPHLISADQKFENLKYCSDCSDKIINVDNMLEDLYEMEKKVLNEKFAIEMQLKESSKKLVSGMKLRAEVAAELRRASIKSTLGKMRNQQIGRKPTDTDEAFLTNSLQSATNPQRQLENDLNPNRINPNLEIVIVKTEEPSLPPVSTAAAAVTIEHRAQAQASHPHPLERKMPKLIKMPQITVQNYSAPAAVTTTNSNTLNGKEEIEESFSASTLGDQFKDTLIPWSLEITPTDEVQEFVDEDGIKLEEVVMDENCYIMEEEEVEEEDQTGEMGTSSFEPFDGDGEEVENSNVINIPFQPRSDLQFEYEESSDMFEEAEAETDSDAQGSAKQGFKCQNCSVTFEYQFEIEDHLKNDPDCNNPTKKPKNAPAMDRSSSESYDHAAAVKNRRSVQPKKCDQCGKVLSTYAVWKNHVLTLHLRQTKYKCALCDYGCQRAGELENHMVIHSAERNFVCSFCSRAFRHKKNLTAHLRIHTGENRYQCAVCLTRFRYHVALTKHLKTNHQIGD